MSFTFSHRRMPSAWNSTRLMLRGKLTDRQIERYRKAGWYSEEYRAARRDFQAKQKLRREGNFIHDGDRVIYSPL